MIWGWLTSDQKNFLFVPFHPVFVVWAGVMDLLLSALPWFILLPQFKMRPGEQIGLGIAMSMGVMLGLLLPSQKNLESPVC